MFDFFKRRSKQITPKLRSKLTTALYLNACHAMGINPDSLNDDLQNISDDQLTPQRMQSFLDIVCSNKIHLSRYTRSVQLEITGAVLVFFLIEYNKPSPKQARNMRALSKQMNSTPMNSLSTSIATMKAVTDKAPF